KNPDNSYANQIIINALADKFYKIRIKAIDALNLQKANVKKQALPLLKNLIENDEKTLVRAAAIDALSTTRDKENISIFSNALDSKSYAVQASALMALDALDSQLALNKARELEKDSRGNLATA